MRGGQREKGARHFADPKGNTTFIQMAVLIDRSAAIDKLIALGFYNGMFSHPLESLREFSFSPNSHPATDDFTGLI